MSDTSERDCFNSEIGENVQLSRGSNCEEKSVLSHNVSNDDNLDSLGPLPSKWEKAYTESGEVYFIDHSTSTSHWLDPRLSKFQKKTLEDCRDDELPYGWEKITDPHYGTYFIDHVNRRTQYENPVIQAKQAANQTSNGSNGTLFTKNPAELSGQRFKTSLVKSSRGLGFTIIGGDDTVDEFLQIKSVVPQGPAWFDGQLQTGDVIVYVNDTCVLGYTHNQIVRLFQSIAVGSTVTLEVCRGYPLPFDPNDPNTEVVTTIAVDNYIQSLGNDRLLDTNYNFLNHEDISSNEKTAMEPNDIVLLKDMNNVSQGKEIVNVRIVKGNLGFGFTIADSACGQRVKKILDHQRCKNLMEGDVLLEINDISLQNMSHDHVVQVLKNCPYNSEANITVQRGCMSKTPIVKTRKLDVSCNKDLGARSKTPTAEIYGSQSREVLPTRPKTPLVDTRDISTLEKDVNFNLNNELLKQNFSNDTMNCDRPQLRLSLIENLEEDELELTDGTHVKNDNKYTSLYMPIPHRYDCSCGYCSNTKHGTLDSDDSYDNAKKYSEGDWSYSQKNAEHVSISVVLNRQENGFGFRIIGGIEDKSQVAVGHIVPGGAADLDGRIHSGDEIINVEGFSVLKASHRQVVQLINQAAARGQVSLILRRCLNSSMSQGNAVYSPRMNNWTQENHEPSNNSLISRVPNAGPTFQVTVQRTENEGFGFVIISSANKIGSTIGRLIEDSPAERCGRLRVGDYIVMVNYVDITHLNHSEIVNLIKESGLSVTLTIAPNPELC